MERTGIHSTFRSSFLISVADLRSSSPRRGFACRTPLTKGAETSILRREVASRPPVLVNFIGSAGNQAPIGGPKTNGVDRWQLVLARHASSRRTAAPNR
jgi:hypothetical protein